jgi:hypothetical protein
MRGGASTSCVEADDAADDAAEDAVDAARVSC